MPLRKASLQDLDALSPALFDFCRVAVKRPGSLHVALRDFVQTEHHLSVTQVTIVEWLRNNGFGRPVSKAY